MAAVFTLVEIHGFLFSYGESNRYPDASPRATGLGSTHAPTGSPDSVCPITKNNMNVGVDGVLPISMWLEVKDESKV